MKKKLILIFALVFLLVGVLCIESVLAGNPTEKMNYCDVLRVLNYLNYQYLLGCDCTTYGTSGEPEIIISSDPYIFDFFRSDYETSAFGRIVREQKYYCYVDNPMSTAKPGTGRGTGEIRMCTEDKYSEYELDYTGGNKKNKECPYSAPFCDEEKNSCNECRNVNDCSKTSFAQQNSDKLLNIECLPNTNLKTEPVKSCEYCVHINGTGSTKIVFIVGQAPPGKTQEEVIQEAYQSVVQTEPYKYLHEEKNAFTFSYVPVNNPYDLFEVYQWRYGVSVSKGTYFYLTDKSYKEIINKVEQVCGKDAIIVYIDNIFPHGFASSGLAVISKINNNVVSHELGHVIGQLADEYPTQFPREIYEENIQTEGINIQPPDSSELCPKFTDKGVDLPNCFYVENNSGYKKSTESSLMNNNKIEPRFNTISCAGILNQVLGMPIERAVYYCEGTELAPDNNLVYNYDISQGIIQQDFVEDCYVLLGSGQLEEGYGFSVEKWSECTESNYDFDICREVVTFGKEMGTFAGKPDFSFYASSPCKSVAPMIDYDKNKGEYKLCYRYDSYNKENQKPEFVDSCYHGSEGFSV